MPFATAVAGVVIRGRMDAVFADARRRRFDVVDWKTGRRRPVGRGRCRDPARRVPAGLGRTGGCRSSGYGPAFHYVRDDVTVRPADLIDADGLVALVAVAAARSAGKSIGTRYRTQRG